MASYSLFALSAPVDSGQTDVARFPTQELSFLGLRIFSRSFTVFSRYSFLSIFLRLVPKISATKKEYILRHSWIAKMCWLMQHLVSIVELGFLQDNHQNMSEKVPRGPAPSW